MIHTDNAAKRLNFIWLGDPRAPMPVEAPIRAWITAGVTIGPAATLTYALIRPVTGAVIRPGYSTLTAAFIAFIAGVVVAVTAARLVTRHVTPTKPLNHHVSTLLAELHTPRPAPARTVTVAVDPDMWIEHDPKHTTTRTVHPR